MADGHGYITQDYPEPDDRMNRRRDSIEKETKDGTVTAGYRLIDDQLDRLNRALQELEQTMGPFLRMEEPVEVAEAKRATAHALASPFASDLYSLSARLEEDIETVNNINRRIDL